MIAVFWSDPEVNRWASFDGLVSPCVSTGSSRPVRRRRTTVRLLRALSILDSCAAGEVKRQSGDDDN